jgi:protein phosphatase
MEALQKSHVGRIRSNNEDTVFLSTRALGSMPNVLIVSDGMGGHNAGELASQKAVAFFQEYAALNTAGEEDLLDYLVSAVRYANRKVYELSLTQRAWLGMGATFTACTAVGGKLIIAHIGDSRLYYIADNAITQVTADHSYVNELVRTGQISPKEAARHPQKNMLTRALGVETDVEVDGQLFDTAGKGLVLLCSDGLTNMLADIEILRIVSKKTDLNTKAEHLIDAANARGGLDNISVILADMSR